jgi:homocysteine S-methyltransferase
VLLRAIVTIDLRSRLLAGPPLLLDGPTGTELARRGVDTSGPQWSAAALESAPEVLLRIHRDYVAAGAEILTANTFRTHARNLAVIGREGGAAELTRLAVEIARRAARESGRSVRIAGSQAPLADCYSPELTPDDDELQAEHALMSQNLAAAGVDLILVETHPTLREALAATRAALGTGLPVIASVVGSREGRLLSGESLAEAAQRIAELPVAAVAVNCVVAESVLTAVETMVASAPGTPVGAYANVGYFDGASGWVQTASVDPAVYQQEAAKWLQTGARFVGSCCGTTPEHIRRLRELIDSTSRA